MQREPRSTLLVLDTCQDPTPCRALHGRLTPTDSGSLFARNQGSLIVLVGEYV